MRKSRRAEIDKPSLAKQLIAKGISHIDLEIHCNMQKGRFTDCMKSDKKHKLADEEIVMISLKYNIPVESFVLSDTQKLSESRRIAAIDAMMKKDYHKGLFERPVKSNRELLSPVEIVKANPVQTSDFAHWVSLPETPNPHIEHKIDGVVAFRYENGNSVLFANEYVNPIHFPMAMEQIRKWGENQIA